MIKILIIDDDSTKINDICSIINEFPDIPKENIEYEIEVRKALHKLQISQYDLVILDIKLPSIAGSGAIGDGGVHLLDLIVSTDRIKKPTCIVGLTSYNDCVDDYKRLFSNQLWTLLKHSKEIDIWKKQMRNKIKHLLEWKKQFVDELRFPSNHDYDFAVITAVEKEYRSLLNLDLKWQPISVSKDPTRYMEATIHGKDRDYKVILARQLQMGMPAASVLSMKLIMNFKPKYICILGIAAGKRDRVNLGDILIAAESWDYGSGKIKEDSSKSNFLFESEPHQISIDSGLKELFSHDYSEILYKIRHDWNKTSSKEIVNDIRVHIGPLASGAAVIQHEDIVHSFIDPQNRKLIGIDMETYAVYYAAMNCHQPKPLFFSIKSVCDFADKEKNDDYQSYAAYVSAQFFYKIVCNSILE
jgi:nucleoside phosphorylase/CheY-like chemotaxis protein